ncbi:MAG: hypothetical protein MZU97_11145 [Bacillus subtilis]|nr:hypothetical protein [Bacillus subtilis]
MINARRIAPRQAGLRAVACQEALPDPRRRILRRMEEGRHREDAADADLPQGHPALRHGRPLQARGRVRTGRNRLRARS